ncbi:MAG: nitroreductase/quinone reductase family protein [Roseiflexaceae bacterium]
MDEQIKRELARGRTADITTIGRKSGQPHRREIWYHNLDGRIYITGSPGKRDWYANLLANPALTLHLKEGLQADLPARAIPIVEPAAKRAILSRIMQNIGRSPSELEIWIADSPLIEVAFEGA